MNQTNNIQQESMLRVGTILRGIYRIDSYLSSGGFGNTYVATNVEFDERIAIKEFFMKGVTQREGDSISVSVSNRVNTNSFLEQREKFKKEARRLRKLKNEHIVAVHDLFEENGTAYYVMDYIAGESLAARLKRTGDPMTESEVNKILPQILDALKVIHDNGIWHLDLKPANIMMDKAGNIKLIDFGASKQLNAKKGGATTSTAISYTNGYAPREQMEQNYEKFGPWTDIYALGATIYNLLTNKRPPLPSDIDDDMSEDKHLALPMPNVSEKMKQLVLSMMRTNRLQRPQSVNDIDLEASSTAQEPKPAPADKDEETVVVPMSGKTDVSKGAGAPTPKPNPEPNPKPNPAHIPNPAPSSSSKKWIGIGVAALLLVGALMVWNPFKKPVPDKPSVDSTVVTALKKKVAEPKQVTNLYFKSALGVCSYSGPVDDDNQPHGTGEASFTDGRLYKGPFIHGKMEGNNVYFRYDNGDTFEGSFRNERFYEGRYSLKSDGSYFVGKFSNGQPSTGQWYDKNGNKI